MKWKTLWKSNGNFYPSHAFIMCSSSGSLELVIQSYDLMFYIIFHVSIFRNVMGKEISREKYFPNTMNIYFPRAENWNYFFASDLPVYVSKINGGNMIYYHLLVNTGKYLPKKGKVRENNECMQVNGFSEA